MTREKLMIGDLVDVHRCECVADDGHYVQWNEYGKVVSITECYITIKYIGREDDYGFEDVEEEDINPIPLTAEILEKNGFIKSNSVSDIPPFDKDEDGNMYYSFKGENKFWGWWQPDNIFFIPANAMGNIEIRYVHELQHALKLCGIAKNIEL